MNDLGVNVAQVLDDNQMSYMNNDDYIRLSRIEEYQTELKHAKFDLTKVLSPENGDDIGYDDLWGEGLKMNWNLVPLEDQKCHINWRQAIDDDGSGLGKLGSWLDQGVGTGVGYSPVGMANSLQKLNVYLENQKDMNAKKSKFEEYVEPAIELVGNNMGDALVDCANNLNDIKNKIGGGTDLDAAAVLAASIALGTSDYASIINKYREVQTALGTTGGSNPALVWTAYATENAMVKRYIDGTLEPWLYAGESENGMQIPPPTVKEIPKPNIVDGGFSPNTNAGRQGEITQIVVHHSVEQASGSIENRIKTMATWSDYVSPGSCDYHYVVFSDGTIISGCPEEYIGGHAGGYNTGRIGIAFAGQFNGQPEEGKGGKIIQNNTMTSEMEKAGVSLIAWLMQKYNLTPSRRSGSNDAANDPGVTLIGHTELYSGKIGTPDPETKCPGRDILSKLNGWVGSVQNGGKYSVSSSLWTGFVNLIKLGLEKEGKTSTEGLGLFPKICFLYVNIMSHNMQSQIDGEEWGFPFSDEDIRTHGGGSMNVTGLYHEFRQRYNGGAGGYHEGVDLQPNGMAPVSGYSAYHVPVRSMKDGTAYTAGQWCHGICVVHNDGTSSRYLHVQNHKVSNGETVRRGQEIAEMGGWGTGPEDYPFHLHVEMFSGSDPNFKVADDYSNAFDPIAKWKANNYTSYGSSGTVKGTYTV